MLSTDLYLATVDAMDECGDVIITDKSGFGLGGGDVNNHLAPPCKMNEAARQTRSEQGLCRSEESSLLRLCLETNFAQTVE